MIELHNVYKKYEMASEELVALDNVSLEIAEGEFTSIMGPSGSGKSTLMNSIGLLDYFNEGEYILNGRNIGEYSETEIAGIRNEEIGFVFQSFNLLPRMTILENVMLPLVYGRTPGNERKERALEALDRVGLADRVDHRPNEISGGQKQRVAIARAIVNNPAVILADEPTGNLDSKTTLEIIKIFQELNQEGSTIIMVTHESEVAEYSKKIVRLRDGKLQDEEIVDTKYLIGGEQK